MLGRHPIDVMLLATDLGLARRFYEGTLGLEVLLENEQFLTFGCGGDSRLVVTKSTSGTREEATKASWRVADLAAEVAELRARGVQVQDLPELGTVEGIADLGFALAAWFIDPHHNWIGLLQLKDPVSGPTAPQPAPRRPTSRTSRDPSRRRASTWPRPLSRSRQI
jgi:catechol-2,3-dioxygenase